MVFFFAFGYGSSVQSPIRLREVVVKLFSLVVDTLLSREVEIVLVVEVDSAAA